MLTNLTPYFGIISPFPISYGKDFYAGMPAVTKNQFGSGTVYYVGTRLEEAGQSAYTC